MSWKKTEKTLLKNKKILAVLAVATILLAALYSSSMQALEIGYLSGTQGLEPQFNSVWWNGGWWSATEKGPVPKDRDTGKTVPDPNSRVTEPATPSSRSFGYSMVLDPDWQGKGMPKLAASTQTLTRDADPPISYKWQVPQGDPIKLSNGTIVQKALQFEMYRYRMDWAMNIWLSGTEWEADGKYSSYGYYVTPNYGGGEIWIKLVPKSFVYFTENPDKVYFAPSYIVLKEPVQWAGTDKDGKIIKNDGEIAARNDLIPKSTGEPLGVYYARGGKDTLTTQSLLQYQGLNLDPAIFRNEYWTRVNLLQFQPYSWLVWGGLGGHGWKYPSAYLHFQVDMFVVGQWTVYYKTGEVPALKPHQPITEYGWAEAILSFFSSPTGQFWLFLMLIAAALILITIFFPSFWILVFGFLQGRRGGGKRG